MGGVWTSEEAVAPVTGLGHHLLESTWASQSVLPLVSASSKVELRIKQGCLAKCRGNILCLSFHLSRWFALPAHGPGPFTEAEIPLRFPAEQ